MIGAKTGRNGHHLFQAQSQQRRAREQNKSEGDLRDDEGVAKALSGATDRARPGFRLERIREMAPEIEPGDWHRDDDSQNHRADQADQCERAVKRNLRTERQTIRTENLEQLSSPRAEDDAEQPAGRGEENGFGYYLLHDMSASRTHGLANRHLLRAAAGADQKEVDQIHRADEQEEKHAALHQQEGRANGADVIRVEWKAPESGSRPQPSFSLPDYLARPRRCARRSAIALRRSSRPASIARSCECRRRPNGAAAPCAVPNGT